MSRFDIKNGDCGSEEFADDASDEYCREENATISGEESYCDTHDNDAVLTLDGSLLSAAFRKQSSSITSDVVQYLCRSNDSDAYTAPCRSASIMRSLVDDQLRTRLSSMRQLAEKLDIQKPADVSLLDNVATAMFDDDVVTWGRIVTLFAFAGYLTRHCYERDLQDCGDAVVQVLDTIIIERLGLWIVANGGWESFDRQFPAVCIFDFASVWKMVAIGALVCGAAFAFYTSVQYMTPLVQH